MFLIPISASRRLSLDGIELHDSISFQLFPDSDSNLRLQVEERNGEIAESGIGSHWHGERLDLFLTVGSIFDASSETIGKLSACPAIRGSNAFLQFAINISDFMYDQLLNFIQTGDFSCIVFYFDCDNQVYQVSPDTEYWIKLAGWLAHGNVIINSVAIHFDYSKSRKISICP